jgi:hypothetical protein
MFNNLSPYTNVKVVLQRETKRRKGRRLAGHGGEDAQKGGFAAAFSRRFDGDVGNGIAQFEGVGMKDPNSKGGGGVVVEDDVPFDDGFDIGEQAGDLDRAGMRSDGVEEDGFVSHNGFIFTMAEGVGQWRSNQITYMKQILRVFHSFPC